MNDDNFPVIAVVGPTASGKTKLAIELCKRLNGEVVSADSIQVYKQMNIGSAKPTIQEMDGITHHLINICDVSDEFDVARYVGLAKECISMLHGNGKLPIVCGGTGLYIDSLMNNITFSECKSDESLRNSLYLQYESEGSDGLFEKLCSIDPESAEKIHKNNVKRLIRAIEIYELTGITMSEHIRMSRRVSKMYNACFIGLTFRDRDILYNRINKRVDLMFEQGLLDEVTSIFNSAYSKTSVSAIGYKEFIPFINGEATLDSVKENIKLNTRRYAKRQLTWFKRNKNINWIYIDEQGSFNKVFESALSYIDKSHVLI